MTQRNAFRGPGNWNVDLSLVKRFFITERVNFQLRAEAQNVFNHANYFLNSGTNDIASDNLVTVSKFGRRQLQFSARLTF